MAVGLRYGAACTACRHNQCVDPPTEDEPLCFHLAGQEVSITSCPQRYAGVDGRDAIRFAEYARKGVLPVEGGLLNQSQHFIEATELAWVTEQEYKRAKGIRDA